ncbi:recombinase family protein [Nocardioides sp. DS6]|uniref:Recombinase family protein n=1 Tax=Nocardioides eburneus TaxID=3231482 RepID=A0ABV3SVD2_9ACTN
MNTATLPEPLTAPVLSLLTDDLAAVIAANRAATQAAVARITERPMTRAAIYARASRDQELTGVTVAKQIKDGHTYAEGRDLPVVGVYRDNGVSAWKSGVVRRDFERLLRDAEAGLFDVVIVRHTDRLYRQLAELPRIIDKLAQHAHIVAIHEGEIDLSTASGIMSAQIKGAVAEHESRIKAERLADHARHRAHNGRMVTGNRPFGWAWAKPCPADETCEHTPKPCEACRKLGRETECEHKTRHLPGARPALGSRGGLVPHPEEAQAVRFAYRAAARGHALYSIARRLNARGYTGTSGGPWRGETVRAVLMMPRHAGLVSHQDYGTDSERQRGRRAGAQNIVAEAADGQRLVSSELWQTVQRILAEPTRRKSPGRPVGTLLSGIAVCDRCGGPLNATNRHYPRKGGGRAVVPAYMCARGRRAVEDRHSFNRARHNLDNLVLDTVREFIDGNADRLRAEAVPDASPVELAAQAEVDRLRRQLDGYAALAPTMDPADYAAAVKGIRAALVEAEKRAAVVTSRPALARLLRADDVPAAWRALTEEEDVEPIRALLRELVVRVRVSTGQPLADHVDIDWQPWVAHLAEGHAIHG